MSARSVRTCPCGVPRRERSSERRIGSGSGSESALLEGEGAPCGKASGCRSASDSEVSLPRSDSCRWTTREWWRTNVSSARSSKPVGGGV